MTWTPHRKPYSAARVTVLPAASPALLSGPEGPWHYRLGRVRPEVERAAHVLYLHATEAPGRQAAYRAAGNVLWAALSAEVARARG